jgi:hypothetical protein
VSIAATSGNQAIIVEQNSRIGDCGDSCDAVLIWAVELLNSNKNCFSNYSELMIMSVKAATLQVRYPSSVRR